MRVGLYLIAAALVTSPMPVSAQRTDQDRKIEEINRESFSEYDGDADGLLSYDEYSLYAMFETSMNSGEAGNQFTAMDADNSGSSTFAEFNDGACCA